VSCRRCCSTPFRIGITRASSSYASKNRATAQSKCSTPGAKFGAYQEQARSFEGLAAIENVSRNLTVGNQQPERAAGEKVTADFFTLLGVPPRLGRTLLPNDQGEGAARVVVLGMMSGRAGLAETRR